MNCEQVQELLSPYIDDMLEKDEMNKVSKHLETCSCCADEYRRLLNLVCALRALGEEDLPEGFNERLINRLNKINKKSFVIPSWASVAAVAAVLMVLFLGLYPMQLQVDEAFLDPGTKQETGVNYVKESSRQGAGNLQESETGLLSQKEPEKEKDNKEFTMAQERTEIPGPESSSRIGDSQQKADRHREINVLKGGGSPGATEDSGFGEGDVEIFNAGALVPEEGRSHFDLSGTEIETAPPFVHIKVDLAELARRKLTQFTASSGGSFQKVPIQELPLGGNDGTKEVYVASIPCGTIASFIDNVFGFGNVVDENLSQCLLSSEPCKDICIQELESRREVLSDLLMDISDVKTIKQVKQEISEIDQEIIRIKSAPVEKTALVKINIIVEEKGN
jgi:hypothetical protein